MATRAKSARHSAAARIDPGTLLGFYRTMVTARRTDDQEILLKRQNKIFFQISGAGHEAVQVGLAPHLRPGSDWFVGKGHDTFAPMGPWIVPKEFYGDPMKRLRQTLKVGDMQMQEGLPGDMIHSIYELIEYASSIITLFPGDVINNGTSGGVGMGTAVRGEQRFLQDGEMIEAGVDGIGVMHLRVRREASRPEGTGAQLPAAAPAQ